MGSGRGKNRRSQATTTPAAKGKRKPRWAEVFNESIWNEFVIDGDLKNYNLYKYYGVLDASGNAPQQPSHADYEKVITELFADAVAIGAIALPSPHKAEDFAFKIGTVTSGTRLYGQEVQISLKASPDQQRKMGHPGSYYALDGRRTMSSRDVLHFVRRVDNCVRDLLKQFTP